MHGNSLLRLAAVEPVVAICAMSTGIGLGRRVAAGTVLGWLTDLGRKVQSGHLPAHLALTYLRGSP